MKKSIAEKEAKSNLQGKANINKYEHHNDIKQNTLTPFKARGTTCGHSASCNWHDNPEILLITDGTGTIRYGTSSIEIGNDEIVIINSQTMHSISSEGGISYYMFIIDNSFFEENGIDITKYTFERVTNSKALKEICLEAYRAYNKPAEERDFLFYANLRSTFLSLILELCRHHIAGEASPESASGGSEQYVKKAMEYINDNYTEKITLEGIAKYIGINKSYFAREFKKYAGQTVHTYINSLRCTRADRCLADGMSVTETAMEAGFGTLSYFSRTYKKFRGIAPCVVREK